jgi:hypothetical protein
LKYLLLCCFHFVEALVTLLKQNETVPQVHALVDLTIEQHFGGILDGLNDLNFCGFAFASTSIGYANSPRIIANANLSSAIITDEAL